ncbi:MAG: hypothetical protein ACTJFV_10875 [Moraxellaceae bacterium]
MSHFFTKDSLREKYKNSFDISHYIKPHSQVDYDTDANSEPDRNYTVNHFNKNFEYVVVWYDKDFIAPTNASSSSNSNGTVTYIDVLFANLTEPKYIKNGDEATSYLKLRIHINHIHKLPFGSIWKNGKSDERFVLNSYEVEVKDNYNIYSFSKAYFDMRVGAEIDLKENPTSEETIKRSQLINEMPFDSTKYFEKINGYDKNQLINIEDGEHKIIVHPLSLFITHYGYSMDIKRIISRYNLDTIEKKLIPRNQQIEEKMKAEGVDEYVVLPPKFTQRDAVFLHQLKYNLDVWKKVERIHNNIQEAKDNKKRNVRIDFWHQPLTLRIKGIPIGNKILCANIIGISEPKLNPINLVLQPKRRLSANESIESQDFLTVRQYIPPDKIEDLNFTHNPVNNLTTLILLERLERIGDLVIINKITNGVFSKPIDDSTRFIKEDTPEELGIGEKIGRGSTGLAKGLFDVREKDQSRFNKIWNHAKEYSKQNHGTVRWFTFGQGLQNYDDFYVMSLSKLHSTPHNLYWPEYVLVIELLVGNSKYYVLEFGEVKLKGGNQSKGFNGIIYKSDDNEDFFNKDGRLVELITNVVSLNGTLNSEFTNNYQGKLALFKHPSSNSSNWIRNGINNL